MSETNCQTKPQPCQPTTSNKPPVWRGGREEGSHETLTAPLPSLLSPLCDTHGVEEGRRGGGRGSKERTTLIKCSDHRWRFALTFSYKTSSDACDVVDACEEIDDCAVHACAETRCNASTNLCARDTCVVNQRTSESFDLHRQPNW